MKYHLWLRTREICRDDGGDGGGDGGGDDGGGDGGGGDGRTFSQEEVNALLAKERRQGQAKVQEQIRALEAIKQEGLTPEDRATLEQQIETLKGQSQTELELAKQSAAKATKKWEAERQQLVTERDAAQKKLERLQVDTVLSTAMGMHGVTPDATPIIRAYIMERLERVPVMGDDNKPTGDLTHVIKLDVPDEDDASKTKTLRLTPDKAIAHLKDQDAFAALFTSKARPGAGGSNAPHSGPRDITQMSQKEYMEYRKTFAS